MAECAQRLELPGPWQPMPALLIDEERAIPAIRRPCRSVRIWITRQLREAAAFCEGEEITGEAMQTMLARRVWREGYPVERMQDEILQEQIPD